MKPLREVKQELFEILCNKSVSSLASLVLCLMTGKEMREMLKDEHDKEMPL